MTKPRSGFQIAFNMFDMDGNERVDRDEFLVLERIFSSSEHGGERVDLFKEVEEKEAEGESEGEKAEQKVKKIGG